MKKMANRLKKIDEARLCELWRERKEKFKKAVEKEKKMQNRMRNTRAQLEAEMKEQQELNC